MKGGSFLNSTIHTSGGSTFARVGKCRFADPTRVFPVAHIGSFQLRTIRLGNRIDDEGVKELNVGTVPEREQG